MKIYDTIDDCPEVEFLEDLEENKELDEDKEIMISPIIDVIPANER